MATNMYVNASGQHYKAASAQAPEDSMVPVVDTVYAGLLSATPAAPVTLRTSYVAAKTAAGIKKETGWMA